MQPHITSIPILQFASGDLLSIQLYRFYGRSSGPKVYLQANLHGAEIVGNAVLYGLLEWLTLLEPDQLNGEIWLVPVCNPLGTNQRSHYFSSGRFNPYDGKDWNRIFWDYEKEAEDLLGFAQDHLHGELKTIQDSYCKRIQARFEKLGEKLRSPTGAPLSEHYRFHLQSLCLDADYLIDVHSTSNQGLDYLYYFAGRAESAKLFGLEYGILLDRYDGDAFDEAFMKPWLALEQCFAKLGRSLQFDREAWTLELGTGMQMKPASVQKGVVGIQNYLVQKKMVQAVEMPPTLSKPQMHFASTSQIQKYYSPFGGMVSPRVALGDAVQQGQVLYHLLSFNKQALPPTRVEVVAQQNGIVYDLASNQAVNMGEYVLATF
jgi:predicted deacylase